MLWPGRALTDPMALRGSLKDFSLPDVFQLITFSRKTGVLRISGSGDATGSVWFREGEVFFAQSNWHHEPLGERLVAARKITPSALEKALDIRSAEPDGGRRLGQVLVDEGYITEKVLEAFVQEQIQDTIFDLMRWEAGEFDFELLPEVVDEDIGLTVSIENVIMEGSRRLDEWARIRKKVPSMDVVFKMATAPGEGTFEISLKPVEWSLLLLVDGTRSVAELARDTGRTDFEVARILYGLFSAGLLEFAAEEDLDRVRVEGPAEDEAPRAETEAEAEPETEVEPEPEPLSAPEPADEPELIYELPLDHEPELGPDFVFEPEPEPEPTLEPEPPGEPAAQLASRPEPEVPEFLIGQAGDRTTDDVTSFAEMMEAVLDTPAAGALPPEPEEDEADATGSGEAELSALETAEEREAFELEAPEPDFERDLMSLGIGELPEELTGGPDVPEISAIEPEPELEVAPVPEPEPEPEVAPAPEPEPEPEVPDLSELLDSLEEPEPEPELAPEQPVFEPIEAEKPEPDAGPFISTDAFVDLPAEETEHDLSTAMSDEMGALTGVRRARPQVSVSSIPDSAHASGLRRDEAVSKALVMKIIDGLKKL
jgi:hypothetical protein